MRGDGYRQKGQAVKVLMLCYELPPIGGGGGRFAAGLAGALAEDGHRIDLVTMGYRRLPSREEHGALRIFRAAAIRRRPFHCSLPEAAFHLLACRSLVRRLLKEEKYELVHAHFIFPDGFTAWRIGVEYGLPFVVTAHGSDVPGYNPDRLRFAHRALRPLWQRLVSAAGMIVCPSQALLSLVLATQPTSRCRIIPGAIDPARLASDGTPRSGILSVARMLRRKGIHHLLEALSTGAADLPVHIVGDGPFLPHLRRVAAEVDADITFHGWLDAESEELLCLYRSSSIFVLPSSRENFPSALLEAMAAGLAIITTAGTGTSEVVGDAAVLVPPGDTAALRRAIDRLVADPEECRRLGAAARRRLEARFSWSAVAPRYLDLYRSVVEGQEG